MKKITTITLFLTVFAFLILTNSIFAADPPGLINYQGILRDSSDKPLNGSYDMIFTFFSASIAGDEILVDQHLAAGTGAVTVSDGLFTAWLGGGSISDGAGPGTYTSMPSVFSNYTNVYLEIEIYNYDTTLWELLNPRIRIISAAYSLNADNLDGKNSLDFLDISSTIQTKSGKAVFNASTGDYGVEGYGPTAGGYFEDQGDSGYAYVGHGNDGISAYGNTTGGYFQDADNSGYAYVGHGNNGISAYGNATGGYFQDLDSSGYAYVGYGDTGIEARGNTRGGYFQDADNSGYSYVGYENDGIQAYGNDAGGFFQDLDSSGYAYVGHGNDGISAYGNTTGGYFKDADNSGYAYVGHGNNGISAYGNATGGYFQDLDSSGYAYAGYGDTGIEARGNTRGGYFKDADNSGYSYVGYGNDGIQAYGNTTGGYFKDIDSSGYAYVGYGDTGIEARGNARGGYFQDADNSGYSYVGYGNYGIQAYGNLAGGLFLDLDNSGYAYVGYGDSGIEAYGSDQGGYFEDITSSGRAYVAQDNFGIWAYGDTSGGFFEDSNSGSYGYVGYGLNGISAFGRSIGGEFRDIDHTGLAYVGYGDRGIWGKGIFAGGTFSHPDNTTYWADVSTSTRKIVGTGTVSFVQNHPYDKSKVITYAAPEGDEVAVYTRGTARLVNGEAVVKLGETFSWVAHPDIGLTAHITPRGEQVVLSVDSLTTSDMIVRGPEGSNALFDYIVYGLRIGFEELAVIQHKIEREAFLPSSEAIQEPYAQNPELKAFNAFERFKRMRQAIGQTAEVDLTRSQALVAAIDENKQEILAKANEQMEMERKQSVRRPDEDQEPMPEALEEIHQSHPAPPELIDRSEKTVIGTIPVDDEGNIHAKSFRSVSPDLTGNVPVSEQAEVGDVLVIDPMNPGMMRLCDTAADHGVVGIVAGDPGVVLGGSSMNEIEKLKVDREKEIQANEGKESSEEPGVEFQKTFASIALSGIVQCKVDAAYGAIQAGDLLTTSQTKGHAMRSDDHASGTIIGKALEPLDAGTGLIKVLVMMR